MPASFHAASREAARSDPKPPQERETDLGIHQRTSSFACPQTSIKTRNNYKRSLRDMRRKSSSSALQRIIIEIVMRWKIAETEWLLGTLFWFPVPCELETPTAPVINRWYWVNYRVYPVLPQVDNCLFFSRLFGGMSPRKIEIRRCPQRKYYHMWDTPPRLQE